MKRLKSLFAFTLALNFSQAAIAHHGAGHSGREVTATVYHSAFHGGTTYCGQTYQHWGVSAAHPWLPCGTNVRVSNGSRSLTVKITDRCECNSIDLSAGAAYKLGVPLDGIARVRISY
jgi:rare lipoprotein A